MNNDMNTNNEENLNNNDNNTIQTNMSEFKEDDYITQYLYEQELRKKRIIIIIVIILMLGLLGYFGYNKFFANKSNNSVGKSNCIDDFKVEGKMLFDNVLGIKSGDIQYIFDSKYDVNFISKAVDFSDDINFKVCYTNVKNLSVDFQIGDTKSSKEATSIELYDKTSGKKITATNIDKLLNELNYHSYGEHTEEGTVVKVDSYPNYKYISNKSYLNYDLEIEFSNGKKVEAIYRVVSEKESKIAELEEGKKYMFDFTVQSDRFNPIEYIITDFK